MAGRGLHSSIARQMSELHGMIVPMMFQDRWPEADGKWYACSGVRNR
jgi:hypothetical protein